MTIDNADELADAFKRRLRSQGLAVPDRAPPSAIDLFEAQYGIRMPVDMRRFYLSIDGMKDGELDVETHVRIWPVEELRPLPLELPEYSLTISDADSAFVFADFMIVSLHYVVWLSPASDVPTDVFLVGDGPPMRIAPSYADFLVMFLEGSRDLHPRKDSSRIRKDPKGS